MKLILQAIKALFRKIEASRTHWEGVEKVDVIAETTVTIPSDHAKALLPDTTQLTVGKTYFIILDGVSYECVAWYSDDECAVIIGNGAIFGGEGGNDEPFSCDSYSDGEIYLNTEKAGTYTISISTEENIVHKLDKKYLPDEVIDSIASVDTLKSVVDTDTYQVRIEKKESSGEWTLARGSYDEIFEKLSNGVPTNVEIVFILGVYQYFYQVGTIYYNGDENRITIYAVAIRSSLKFQIVRLDVMAGGTIREFYYDLQ